MKYLYILICLVSGCASAVSTKGHMSSKNVNSLPVEERLPQTVKPDRYRIHLKVDPNSEQYTGRVEIGVQAEPGQTAIVLHSLKHEIIGLQLVSPSGELQGVTHTRGEPDRLIISSTQPLPKSFRIVIDFAGQMTNPLFGMYRVQHRGHWYIYSDGAPRCARSLPMF